MTATAANGAKGRDRKQVLFAIVAPFQAFFRLEAAGGLVMIFNAALALVWANSPARGLYDAIFHAPVQLKIANVGIDWTVHHFTNDGLMTLFFVVAGMEIKRQIALGELRTWNRAALPLVAAAGGMIVPALIYLALNPSGPERAGWGIPMATDIAFALGCLSLVRRRVPTSVFVFLTALAIFDDLGAILVIALFYGGKIDAQFIVFAALLTGLLVLLGRARVQAVWVYAVVGVVLWAVVLQSGIHATVAGVIIGLALPTTPSRSPRDVLDDLDVAITSLRRDCDRHGAPEGTLGAIERHLESVQSPLDRTMHGLHALVAFGIVPLFALANAGVTIGAGTAVGSSVALGAFLGLTVGKPVGVLGATWIAIRSGLAPRPSNSSWAQVVAAGLMAGIGFTMSLFVGNLGLGGVRTLEDQAKLGVLGASLVSALAGLAVLRLWSPPAPVPQQEDMPVVLDVPRFARGYGVRPCDVTGPLVDHSVADLDVRRRFGVTVVGVWRGGKPSVEGPRADPDRGAVEGPRADPDRAVEGPRADPDRAVEGPRADPDRKTSRKLEPIEADYKMREGDVLLVAGADEAAEAFCEFARGPA